MREYYKQRFFWIFHYTSKNFFYCLAKTLCVVVGLPIYLVAFVGEMVLAAVNMLFCWIPILNVVVMTLCKALTTLLGLTFYICILTDLKNYKQAIGQTLSYDIADIHEEKTEPQPEGQAEPQPEPRQLDDGSSADSPKQP